MPPITWCEPAEYVPASSARGCVLMPGASWTKLVKLRPLLAMLSMIGLSTAMPTAIWSVRTTGASLTTWMVSATPATESTKSTWALVALPSVIGSETAVAKPLSAAETV